MLLITEGQIYKLKCYLESNSFPDSPQYIKMSLFLTIPRKSNFNRNGSTKRLECLTRITSQNVKGAPPGVLYFVCSCLSSWRCWPRIFQPEVLIRSIKKAREPFASEYFPCISYIKSKRELLKEGWGPLIGFI